MATEAMNDSLVTGVDNGTTNDPLQLDNPNLPMHMTVAAFTGIAWYNVVELNIAVYMTFRRKRGLYFWSVFACIWGIAIHSAAFILKLYGVVTVYQITVTLITIGWYAMVTGQSLVLYSRLHLVVYDQRIVRAILAMILFNALCMHLPTTVLTYGSNSPSWRDFIDGFRIMEKLQMTMFCVQELIISGIYIWATLQFLRPIYRRHIRSVMLQLIWINVTIIIMDLAMLTVEYLGMYFLEAVMKGAVYSVKLKLEFAVLNQLMQIATSSRRQRAIRPGDSQVTTSPTPPSRAAKSTGIRYWIRLFVPRPVPDALHDEPNNYFVSPSFFQSSASTGQQQHRQPGSPVGMEAIRSPVAHKEAPVEDEMHKISFHHDEETIPDLSSPNIWPSSRTAHSLDHTSGPSEREPPLPSSNRRSVSNIRVGHDGESRASSEVGLHRQ